ncbi:sensor histidine kinase N-terminal domain-containing protein [Ideonella sp. 4Y16]|uniref:histidine kinase n=1 Tax=Ideonella alba TaxID=2824118 RepID=A0A940YA14_9BURK|nr:sensor histidine kinase [Ideonella alba]MBQ0930910.1 sensor histidine kinase N-terminal domain-containing protein [Ideonella alba]MBQ0942426.1 sensor histidine kinase N-terminal domain-containing protein [Ideonella alba]
MDALRRLSLRNRLLLGILLPMLAVIALNGVVLYRQALKAADTAYDRTLLATAKSIGDLLEVERVDGRTRLKSTLLYSALEAFEADNRSRLYYKVIGFDGETVSGFEALPAWHGRLPQKGPYAALVDFYDSHYGAVPVRMAVLLQPVTWDGGQGMATVQVAETLELRESLARQLLIGTLWRETALLGVIAAVVAFVVHRAMRPVQRISQSLRQRAQGELSPIEANDAPRELRPLVEATNQLMGRLRDLLEQQKRFVRDSSHQLRTPLAVLKAQVQSARRGDLPAEAALAEIGQTVERATELANQMLALAKVAQLRRQDDAPVTDWAEVVRQLALDMAPLMAERELDVAVDLQAAPVRAHEWALRELSRNLIHNAVKHGPPHSALTITLLSDGRHAALTIADGGPGISEAQRQRLFQPFSAGDTRSGSGLGLSICHDVVLALGGQIALENRGRAGAVQGLDAIVRLPLAAAAERESTP